jgi:cyanate lyase
MKIFTLPLLLLFLACTASLKEDKLCEGNRFVFLSTYVLGLQTDLKLTFADITKSIQIDEVFYQQELYRSYRISNITQRIVYNEGKQTAKLAQKNVLRVTGGTIRI